MQTGRGQPPVGIPSPPLRSSGASVARHPVTAYAIWRMCRKAYRH